MIRYIALGIGVLLLVWLGYLFVVALPKAKNNEPGARLDLFFNGAGFAAVVGMLVFVVTSFQE